MRTKHSDKKEKAQIVAAVISIIASLLTIIKIICKWLL